MKKNKSEHNMPVLMHIAIAIAIMLVALFISDAISNIFPTNNVSLKELLSTILYIGVTLWVGLLYAKHILHFSSDEIGVCPKMPEVKWTIIGICLPLSVIVFYLHFTDGRLVKSDNTADILSYLINAIFPVGIASGVCEEFIFRGLIMRTLERKWNRTVAVLVPSVLFATIHTLNMNLEFIDIMLLIVAGTSVGVMFSLIALQSGTIWSSAIVHALWNTCILGGILTIEAPGSGPTISCFYRYELFSANALLTGGRYGIESALPAIIGYWLVSAVAVILLSKSKEKQ